MTDSTHFAHTKTAKTHSARDGVKGTCYICIVHFLRCLSFYTVCIINSVDTVFCASFAVMCNFGALVLTRGLVLVSVPCRVAGCIITDYILSHQACDWQPG